MRIPIGVLALLTVALGLVSLGGGRPVTPVYAPYSSDVIAFGAVTSSIRVTGAVEWSVAFSSAEGAATFRGRYGTAAVAELTTSGCLSVMIIWNVGSPGSHGQPDSSSEGWHRRCGPAGTSLSLAGWAFASPSLVGTCVLVRFGPRPSAPSTYRSTWCAFD